MNVSSRTFALPTFLTKAPFSFVSKTQFINYVIEKVCILAIGVFSAYTNHRLFTPWFFGGILIGVYQHFEKNKPVACTHLKLVKNKETIDCSSDCVLGFVERGTGIKLPKPIAVVAAAAFLVEHIDHHSRVLVPIMGLYFGALCGKNIMKLGDYCDYRYHKWTAQRSMPSGGGSSCSRQRT